MALIGANELKKKMLIEVEGQPYNVLDVFFATPTARGASTMVRTRLKNLLNGSVQEKSFRTSEKFPEPDVEIAAVSFLYTDGDGFHGTRQARQRDPRRDQRAMLAGWRPVRTTWAQVNYRPRELESALPRLLRA